MTQPLNALNENDSWNGAVAWAQISASLPCTSPTRAGHGTR
jgi:hypothetical protein